MPLGIRCAERVLYGTLFFGTLFRRPHVYRVAITFAIYIQLPFPAVDRVAYRMMDKYQVDGALSWVGYRSRSETVYISLAAQAVTMNDIDR